MRRACRLRHLVRVMSGHPHPTTVDTRPEALALRHQPATGGRMTTRRFEFRVQGSMSDRTRNEFYGLSVADAPPETIIFGEVVDESHLHGILALVRSLNLHLISMHEIRE